MDVEILKRAGLSDEEVESYKKEEYLRRFKETLTKSKYKCMTVKKLLNILPDVYDHSNKELILKSISSKRLSREQIVKLHKIMIELDNTTKKVKYNTKNKIDRVISRLVKNLNLKLSREWCLNDITHSRKLRRTRAYKFLKKSGIGKENYEKVLEMFNEDKEQKYLELLVRDDKAVQFLDTSYLLNNLEKEYWRMRVIEVLIKNNNLKEIESFYKKYPWEFVYATGRTKEQKCLSYIRNIINSINDFITNYNLKLLGISAWTFGELNSKKDIENLYDILNSQIDRNVG